MCIHASSHADVVGCRILEAEGAAEDAKQRATAAEEDMEQVKRRMDVLIRAGNAMADDDSQVHRELEDMQRKTSTLKKQVLFHVC